MTTTTAAASPPQDPATTSSEPEPDLSDVDRVQRARRDHPAVQAASEPLEEARAEAEEVESRVQELRERIEELEDRIDAAPPEDVGELVRERRAVEGDLEVASAEADACQRVAKRLEADVRKAELAALTDALQRYVDEGAELGATVLKHARSLRDALEALERLREGRYSLARDQRHRLLQNTDTEEPRAVGSLRDATGFSPRRANELRTAIQRFLRRVEET